MKIVTVVEYLNRTKKYNLPTGYYNRIQTWRDWWKGFHESFHQFTELNGDRRRTRKLYSLKMGKKVCEDWAAILLNEKTQLTLEDKASSGFLQGDDGTGGVLGNNDFWAQGNALVEKAFMSGTGAFVLKFSKMAAAGEVIVKSPDAEIRIDYLTAQQIIPITVRQGKIIEAAFASEVVEKGESHVYIETHELTAKGYKITNEYFNAQNDQLTPAPLPQGVAATLNTGSDVPLFCIFSPNIANIFDGANGLGMSIYAQAIDNLMGVDLAFNNFCRDFKLGGKKVFYDQSLVRLDAEGNPVTPDDVMQQLFVQVGEGLVDESGRQKAVQEFNPALRVQENKDGIQAQLDYLSFKVGLGTKHYQFNAGSVVTATQYMGDKQELIQNAAKHYIAIERALQGLVRAILWAGREILGVTVNPDAKVTVKFEDSYIIDTEAEKMQLLQEIRDGVALPEEYRMRFYGETLEEAKKMLGQIRSNDELMGFADVPLPAEGATEVSGKTLNGAQTQSLIAIMSQYASKTISEGQAVNLISTAIGISKDEAKKILRGVV